MHQRSQRLCTRMFTAAALAVIAQAGLAAEQPNDGRIQEIIITAEKREASVQETAIAITAFGKEELGLRGIDNIEDLQFNVPNLVISPNSQSPVEYAYIRGVGTDQPVAGFDPGVAYHVDGVYIGQPSSIPGDLWDMERVEVLRGPQGTLYGKNTTGGSINVITAAPTDTFEANIEGMFGNYSRKQIRGAISGPLVEDRISGRLSFIWDDGDGYQSNNAGPDGDVTDNRSIRGKLKFILTDNADLTFTAQHFVNQGAQSQKRLEAFTQPVYAGARPNPSDPRKVSKDFPGKLDLENDFLSAVLTWDLGFAELRSITGYVDNHWNQQTDIDTSSNDIQYQLWNMDTEQFTQEVQLVSAGDSALQWIVGAFYFDEDLETEYFFQDRSAFGFRFNNGGDLQSESFAVFAQVGYDFRDSGLPIRIVGGLRYTEDTKEIDEFQKIPEFGLNLAATDDNEWKESTGKLELDYYPMDDVMLYASFSRGYKGGGFSIGQFDTYDPEKEDAYEIGAKTQFWDNRAQVNLSAFYNKYDDLQVNFLTVSVLTTDNAAQATIEGIEVEALLLPLPDLQLGASLSLMKAEYDEYQFSPTLDLGGDKLNRAPEKTVGLFAQYDWSLGEAGNLTLRGDYRFQDEVYFRVQNIERHRQGAFDRINARVRWTSNDGAWSGEFFIDNLEDDDDLRNLFVSDGLSTGNNTFVSYHPPRTLGLRVGWHLGE